MDMIKSARMIYTYTNNIGIYHPKFTEKYKYTQVKYQYKRIKRDQDDDEAEGKDRYRVSYEVEKVNESMYRG